VSLLLQPNIAATFSELRKYLISSFKESLLITSYYAEKKKKNNIEGTE